MAVLWAHFSCGFIIGGVSPLWTLLCALEIWIECSFSEVIQKLCLLKAGLAWRECTRSGKGTALRFKTAHGIQSLQHKRLVDQREVSTLLRSCVCSDLLE